MSTTNTVRKFPREQEPAAATFGSPLEGGRSPAITQIKRLNINLPKTLFDELEGMAKASGRTMTEIVRNAVGVVAVLMAEEKRGNKAAIVDPDGKPLKELIMPR